MERIATFRTQGGASSGRPIGPAFALPPVMADTTSLRDRACGFVQQIVAVYAPISERSLPCAYMANQLFHAASAIAAMLDEEDGATRQMDPGERYAIALHEAKEARYWLRLLVRSHIEDEALTPLEREASEFVAMLTTSVQRVREPEAS